MRFRCAPGLIAGLLAACAVWGGRADAANAAAGPAAATRPAAPPAVGPQRVVKVISTSADAPRWPMGRGRDAGNDPQDPNASTWLVVAPVEGGKPVRLTVAEEFRRRFAALRLARGEWVTVTLAGGRGNGPAAPGAGRAPVAADTVASVARFDGPKALANPNTHVLDGFVQQKVGAQTFWAAKLSRFGQTKEALIPNRPAAGGAPVQPDPALVARLRAVPPGELVDVELAPGPAKNTVMLVDAYAAREPLWGEFVRLATPKELAGRKGPAVVIEAEGKEQAYAFPTGPASAAMQVLAKRLKPGHGVTFLLRDPDAVAASTASVPATSPAAPLLTLRDLKLDGHVEPTGEKSLDVVSTYVRVQVSEAPRGLFGGRRDGRRGPGGPFGPGGPGAGNADRNGSGNAAPGAANVDVEYHPGPTRPEARSLARSLDRVLSSESEVQRLKITPEQYKDLDAALRGPRAGRADGAESARWAAAYQAWVAARDDDARRTIEQDMLWAGQELSARWRQDYRAADAIVRSVLSAEQLAELLRAGRDDGPTTRTASPGTDEPPSVGGAPPAGQPG